MSEKYNISSLFDPSGNLTFTAMEHFLRDELSQTERALVEKHLAVSEFDREALEGLQKLASNDLRKEVDDLQKNILVLAGKKKATNNFRFSSRSYWVAAAGLAGLIGLSVLFFFMFRGPIDKPQLLAVMQPDTITPASVVIQEDQKQSASENDIVPEPPPVTRINIVEDEEPAIEKELAEEPVVVINDEVIVDADLLSDEKFIDDIKAKDETVQEEYIVVSEMASPKSSRSMTKMALNSEEEMAEESQVFMVVEQMPEFPGGDKALYKFLADSIQYPTLARESNIQGKVFVTFTIEKDGTIAEVRVLRGIGGGCDEEALRVIKSMPKWMPGKQRGIPVRVQFNLAVKFSLE